MPLKILLVDDNPGELRFLHTFFAKHAAFAPHGVEIFEALAGEEGFELFLREKPDLTFVDLLLPKMDGATLCSEIRRHQGGSTALLFAMSSIYRADQVAQQLHDELNVEFMAKPLDLQALPAKLLALLVARGVVDSAAVSTAADLPADGQRAAEALVDFGRPTKGTLESVGLPALLVHAADQSTTGTLRLTRGKLHKLIYLRDGKPVFVDSNVRNETLGAYLLGKHLIDEEALTAALRHSRAANLKLGEALVALGLLEQSAVDAGLKAQARLKIATTLRWEDGAFQFTPGDDFSQRVPDCSFEVVPLAVAALERLRGRDDLVGLLRARMNHLVVLTPLGQRQHSAIGSACGDAFARVLRRELTLAQLADAGGDVAAALARVQALKECQLIDFQQVTEQGVQLDGSPGLASVGEQAQLADFEQDESGLRQLAAYTGGPAADTQSDSPAIGAVQEPLATDTIPSEADLQDSAPAPQEESGDPADQRHVGATLESWLAGKVSQIGRQTYYELLEIDRSATTTEIDEAVEQLVLRCELARSEGAEPEMCDFVRQELQRSYDLLADDEKRGAYDDFLDTAQTVQPAARRDDMAAELAFREGKKRLQEDRLGEAVAALRQAVEADPEQPDYVSLYGWALFRQRGGGEAGAAVARPHLRAALQLAPESAEVNERAGHIELGAGDLRQASAHFQLALKFGSPSVELYQRQRAVLVQLADYQQLEHLYRHMIYRLREGDPADTLPFWLELVQLYQDKLGQPDDARLALSVIEKMAPADPRVVEAMENADVFSATDWPAVCDRLGDLVGENCEDPAPLHELVTVYQRTCEPERVLAVVSILAACGEATDEQRALLARLRPRALLRREPIPPAELEQLRHGADNEIVEQVVAELSDLICAAFPVPLEALGSAPERQIQLEQLPESSASTIAYGAELLQVELPELYLSHSLAESVVPRPEGQAALVISESVLQQADQRALAFAAARALGCLSVGRRHVFARSGNDLKTAFLAALSASQPGMPVSDPTGAVQRLREQIQQDAALTGRLGEALQRLFAEGVRINLSDWIRGVRRTSARIGLLACGDVMTALEQVAADPPTAQDVVTFTLSRPVGSACSRSRG